MRLTPHRAAVLETLRASHDHPTAAEIYRKVRRKRPGVAYATIYNALNWLTRNGLAAELKFGDEASRYDPVMARHDHLVCTRCGNLMDYEVPLPQKILAHAARQHGFRIEAYRLELFGICPRCTSSPRLAH
jgi:Fur family ferric uptake transcriptional regulator/Fur family peroxide stress response transcriptional regulator